MCSVDIVDVINEERGERAAVMRHDNFLTKIEKHPGIDSPKFLGQYKDSTGRKLKCYNLPKREAELMVMSESLKVQTRVYDRLAAIEAGALPAPLRATHKKDESGLPAMRQAKALKMNIESAKELCAMFPDLGKAAQQTIYAKLINDAAGADIVPLPAVGRLYSATEIAKKYGGTPQGMGKLAIANGLKDEKYGQYVLDKSRSSAKEMSNFLYNEAGVARIGELLGRTSKLPPPAGQGSFDI
jgi:hypothetical protein